MNKWHASLIVETLAIPACHGSFEKMNKSLVQYWRFPKADLMARHICFLHWCLWYPGPWSSCEALRRSLLLIVEKSKIKI